MITIGTINIGRPFGSPDNSMLLYSAGDALMVPLIKKAINARIEAGTIYFILLLTVSPIFAFWLSALAMVVSDIGAIKSPNVAPPMMAPTSVARCAPASQPAGYRIGPQINMVAKLDPVESDTIEQITKVVMMKPTPPICILPMIQVSASTNPVTVISTPMMDANSQAVIIIMTIF